MYGSWGRTKINLKIQEIHQYHHITLLALRNEHKVVSLDVQRSRTYRDRFVVVNVERQNPVI